MLRSTKVDPDYGVIYVILLANLQYMDYSTLNLLIWHRKL